MNEYFRKNKFLIKMILTPLLIMQVAIIFFNNWDILLTLQSILDIVIMAAIYFIDHEVSFVSFMDFSLITLIASLPTYMDFSFPTFMVGLYFFWMVIFSRRMLASILFSTFPFIALYVANIYKIKMLGIELMPHDFLYFFSDFASNYKTFIYYPSIIISILAFIIILFLITKYLFLFEQKHSYHSGLNIAQVIFAVLLIGISGKEFAYAKSANNQATVNIANNLTMGGDNIVRTMLDMDNQGYFNRFSYAMKLLGQEATALYIEPGPYLSGFHEETYKSKPDIFVILQESTFNPESIQDCHARLCKTNPFEVDNETLQSGYLKVHTMGGGTWLSEFAVLTGLDWRLFGQNGAYAPYSLAPRIGNSLPKYLKSIGYKTIAIYPVSGNFLNAERAYQYYGFDKFYSSDTLGLPANWRTLDDKKIYEALQRVLSEESDTPVFAMVLTINNHGPHGDSNIEDIGDMGNIGNIKHKLSDYLVRMENGIAASHYLDEFMLARKKPAIWMRFGDHQPSFDGDINKLTFKYPFNEKAGQKNFYTGYIIKSNFIKQKPVFVNEDIAYLSSTLLHLSGAGMDKYFSSNKYIFDICNGDFLICTNESEFKSYLRYIFNETNIYRKG
jgi:phosphoglycerol transferase MdoB-like AlkP superfamily enzyme